MYRPKEEYSYYVSCSIARLWVAEVDFIYDIKKDDFSKSWRSLSIHSDGFLATHYSRTNELQETCQIIEPQNVYWTNVETPELTCFRVFTELTKKLAEPTSFRVFTEQKRVLAKPTRLRILAKKAKQRLWLLLMENLRNNVSQPLSRMAQTKNTAEKNTQWAHT